MIDDYNFVDPDKCQNKMKGLEDLDALGKSLLKENLSGATYRLGSTFNRYDIVYCNTLKMIYKISILI